MEAGNRGRHKKTASKYLKCWYLDRDGLICIDDLIVWPVNGPEVKYHRAYLWAHCVVHRGVSCFER